MPSQTFASRTRGKIAVLVGTHSGTKDIRFRWLAGAMLPGQVIAHLGSTRSVKLFCEAHAHLDCSLFRRRPRPHRGPSQRDKGLSAADMRRASTSGGFYLYLWAFVQMLMTSPRRVVCEEDSFLFFSCYLLLEVCFYVDVSKRDSAAFQ